MTSSTVLIEQCNAWNCGIAIMATIVIAMFLLILGSLLIWYSRPKCDVCCKKFSKGGAHVYTNLGGITMCNDCFQDYLSIATTK